jgi:hypothetical protein
MKTTSPFTADELDQVVAVIRARVEPQSWKTDDASIHVVAGKLLVRQKEPVLRKIHQLLGALDLLEPGGGQLFGRGPAGFDVGGGFGGGY